MIRKPIVTCSCGEYICKSEGTDKFIFRGHGLIIEKGMSITKCPKCKKSIEFPIDLMISKAPRLYIDKK